MKITFITEDYVDGFEADWPAVPGTGDHVSFRYTGGTDRFTVTSVEYEADGDHNLKSVRVHLEL